MQQNLIRMWLFAGTCAAGACFVGLADGPIPQIGGEAILRLDPGGSPGTLPLGCYRRSGPRGDERLGLSPASDNPVDLTDGHKLETVTDLEVRMVGLPFVLERQYTSGIGYGQSARVGFNWSLSTNRILEVEEVDGPDCPGIRMMVRGIAKAAVSAAWCQELGELECEGGYSPAGLKLDGPTSQRLFKASRAVTVGETTTVYPVWRLSEFGQWDMEFYRKTVDTDDSDDGYEDPSGTVAPSSGLVGRLLQVRDPYGNRHEYSYVSVPLPPSGNVSVASEVKCYTKDLSNADQLQARIAYTYDNGIGGSGRLLKVEVFRPFVDDEEEEVLTQRVQYSYAGASPSAFLGVEGDLIQVQVDELVDPAPSASPGDPVWRSLITQYRYHTGATETGDADEDGFAEEHGAQHQLKMVINPAQVEFYAQLKADHDSATDATVDDYAGEILTLHDGDVDSDVGLSPTHLAAKVVSHYYEVQDPTTYLDGRVKTQYLLSGCGCATSGAQGMREDFEYFEYSEGRTTKVVQSKWDENAGEDGEWVGHRLRLIDLAKQGALSCDSTDSRGWYTVNDAFADLDSSAGHSGMYWVVHYEYSGDGLMIRKYMPSAMLSYTPYDPEEETAPTYSPKTTAGGLIYAYAYDSEARMTEVRLRDVKPGSDVTSNYWLVSKTTYGTGDESHLPVTVERIRTEQQTTVPGTADDVETTNYDYGFHTDTNRGIAWVKTSVEAETTGENGPGGWYDSWEIYDSRGLNTWSIAADASRTKRVFDNDESYPASVSRTGSVVKTVANADSTNDSYPTTGVPTSGVPADRNDEATAGAESLTTTLRRDILGRVQEVVGPGGNTRVTTREMRANAERPGLLYFAQVELPHSLSSTSFDGPMTIEWKDAAGKTFEVKGYKPGGSYTVVTTPGQYRQVVSNYSLGTVLSRSYMVQHVTGLNEEVRQWFDPAVSTSYYKTMYEYDALGRISEVTGPTQDTATSGTRTKTTYDFLDRVKSSSVSAIGSSTWTEIERRYYDSTTTSEGVGNGNLTYVVRPIDNSTNDRAATYAYDFRDRLTGTLSPLAPHQAFEYDNLGRVVRSAALKGSVASTTLTTSDTDRVSLWRTSYSQRGRAFRTEQAIDPSVAVGSATFLATNSWFDGAGRTVGLWAPGAPMVKTTFDGLGRTTAVYQTDRGGDSNPQGSSYSGYSEVHGSRNSTPTHASVLTDDRVIQQSETKYVISANSAKGKPDLFTVRRRAADDAGSTGSLAAVSSAVDVYTGQYYDAAGRPTHAVEYGTCQATFESGGAEPSITQGSPPSSSATVLVAATSYDDRGKLGSLTDPAGTVTKFYYDGLGREYGRIENASANATLVWNGTTAQWQGDDFSATPGTDRAVSMVFNPRGDVIKYVAHVGDTGTGDQVTEYTYGVSSSTSPASEIVTDSRLLKVVYPGPGSASDRTVTYAYNRQGDLKAMTDQNGTAHSYVLDKLGRQTRDEVTSAGADIDDQIDTIERSYDGAGRLAWVQSIEKTSNDVLNEVEFEYTPFGQVSKVWQNTVAPPSLSGSGEVTISSGAPTGTTRLVKYSYDDSGVTASGTGVVPNYSRVASIDYPRNSNSGGSPVTAVLGYAYDGLGHSISRPSGLTLDSTEIVKYEHAGLDIFTLVDYVDVNIQLDRTVSGDGKRRYDTVETSQSSGVYPGLDRFGRVVRQDWVDTDFGPHATDSSVPAIPQVVSLGYAYDLAGSRTRMVDLRKGSTWNQSFEYEYDGLRRLTAADRGVWNGSSLGSQSGNQEWMLDPLGNWLNWKRDANRDGDWSDAREDEDRDFNDANELTARDFTSGTDESLTYDKAGNLRTITKGTLVTTFTHDAWNRLVKVETKEGSDATLVLLKQQHNGLNWRTWKHSDTLPPGYWNEEEEWTIDPLDGTLDEVRYYTYDTNWRLLDERIEPSHEEVDSRRVRYVWGLRYIDDCVLHRVDVDNDNDGEYGEEGEAGGTYHHLTDAMFSTAAIVEGSYVVERISYDPYGRPRHHFGADVTGNGDAAGDDLGSIFGAWGKTIDESGYSANVDLSRDGVIDGDDLGALLGNWRSPALAEGSLSELDNVVGFDGYIHDRETGMYTVRNRTYEPELGRWCERDPIGYADGQNLYQQSDSSTPNLLDPTGLACDTDLVPGWCQESCKQTTVPGFTERPVDRPGKEPSRPTRCCLCWHNYRKLAPHEKSPGSKDLYDVGGYMQAFELLWKCLEEHEQEHMHQAGGSRDCRECLAHASHRMCLEASKGLCTKKDCLAVLEREILVVQGHQDSYCEACFEYGRRNGRTQFPEYCWNV